MRFLKKASYKDILGNTRKNQMSFVEDITDRYSEYELYLSQDDLNELLPDKNEDNKEKEQSKSLNELIEKLRKKGEAISAIHCPESLYQTYNECSKKDKSTNYLSLCECIRDIDSKKILEKVIELAIQINQGQYLRKNSKVGDEDNNKEKDIIVIIHEGCEIGCSFFNKDHADCVKNDITAKTQKLIEDLNKVASNYKIQFKVKIAIENIPPFYCTLDEKVPIGQNCWWDRKEKENPLIFNRNFFVNGNKTKSENQEISDNENKGGQEKGSDDKNPRVVIGACIDFCHIIASYYIKPQKTKSIDCSCEEVEKKKKRNICNEIEGYYNKIKEFKEYVYLFHVSNYGKNGEHGQNFSMDEDAEIIEKIRSICKEIPEALITFEMADGEDVEKAQRRFDKMLYFFSKKHIAGKLGELLKSDEKEDDYNKDLREFFDNLFELYSCDYEDIFTITNKAYEIKKFILENKKQNETSAPFGYDRGRNEEDVALLRLKAYIYYTRFCNLGEYLAENYYNEESFLGKDTKEDFGLAMKYFMLNDIWHQCEYTGVAFKFLIDFLPREETVYRFYDGIDSINSKCLEEINKNNDDKFNKIINKIYTHVVAPGKKQGSFYSMGKNFGPCLFKYYNPHDNDKWEDNEWSLKIYDNLPVNYIETTNRKYSIPAFLQIQLDIKNEEITNICLDISCFSGGIGKWEDKKDKPTWWGFINKCLVNDQGGINKIGSITDGEIVATTFPENIKCKRYQINTYEWFLLKWLYENRNKTVEDAIDKVKWEEKEIYDENWKTIIESIVKLKSEKICNEDNLREIIAMVNCSGGMDIKNREENLRNKDLYNTDNKYYKEIYNEYYE